MARAPKLSEAAAAKQPLDRAKDILRQCEEEPEIQFLIGARQLAPYVRAYIEKRTREREHHEAKTRSRQGKNKGGRTPGHSAGAKVAARVKAGEKDVNKALMAEAEAQGRSLESVIRSYNDFLRGRLKEGDTKPPPERR
jgi:hypothetical protein